MSWRCVEREADEQLGGLAGRQVQREPVSQDLRRAEDPDHEHRPTVGPSGPVGQPRVSAASAGGAIVDS